MTVHTPMSEIDDGIDSFIVSHVPDAKRTSSVGAEVIYQLPLEAASLFPQMLKQIDKMQSTLSIK
jgi:hypothetical protein